MEPVVYKDSPLAEYLEGEGEGDQSWTSPEPTERPPTPPQSYAPRGPSTVQAKFRRRLPQPLRLAIPRPGTVSRFHDACSRAVNSRLGSSENARFLEQFRYTIVASQLLSNDVNVSHYNASANTPPPAGITSAPSAPFPVVPINLTGVVITGGGAFVLVWILHWARGPGKSTLGNSSVLLVLTVFAVIGSIIYAYIRRQWLQYLRHQAVDAASTFVTHSQAFDAAASAALTLVQEVELVSRGYQISSPLPPISRLEERSQTRRCARLRRALHGCLATVLPPLGEACSTLRPLGIDVDLDKYYDIYELSNTDIQQAEVGYSEEEFDDMEILKAFKILLHRLFTLRKVFLCSLLALDADGGKPDFARWGTAVEELHHLSDVTAGAEEKLRKILSEEEQFTSPATPKTPLAPGRERVRTQLRQLGSLSQGIRGLQARMHVLREESDKALDRAEDVTELGSDLMTSYEAIGSDLRILMQEWESGKATLAANIDKNEKRMSQLSSDLRSPTLSLGGATAVEGSPVDALRALSGDDRSRWSMSTSTSDDAEVFEAVALPRQRSSLTREERLAKMKEDRARTAAAREKGLSNTSMLRELESVINLRPKPKTGPGHARVTSM